MTAPLSKALEAYQRFDPAGWVDVYRVVPFWAGLIAIGVGAVMLLLGNGRLFRLVAGPLGAAVALLWAPLLAQKLGFAVQARTATVVAAIALGGLGLWFPPGALFFICGVFGGLVAGALVGGTDWVLGFFPGFLVVGALGALAHRFLAAVVSSAAGGWFVIVGLLAALAPVGSLSSTLSAQPWGCLIAAGLFAIAGAVFQLFVRMTPEERALMSDEKRRKKKRLDEQKALDKRWSSYSKDKGLDT